jgi:hypothetical protein
MQCLEGLLGDADRAVEGEGVMETLEGFAMMRTWGTGEPTNQL